MSSPSVCTGILQPLDILQYLSSQFVFDLHPIECCGQIQDLVLREFANFHCFMEVKTRENARRVMRSDAKERFKGNLIRSR